MRRLLSCSTHACTPARALTRTMHRYIFNAAPPTTTVTVNNRYQPVLSRCPWFPTVGNHEYYSGEELSRYLDSTWEKWNSSIPQTQSHDSKKGGSTATSTLGKMISMANVHGAGLHGSTPSNTSRFVDGRRSIGHTICG